MKTVLKSAALAIAGSAMMATPVLADDHTSDAPEMTRGEKKLAKMLEGRVAGEPQSCIFTGRSGDLRVLDGTALVYKQGRTLWVNRTRNPDSIDDNDYLVIKKHGSGSQLCKLDNVTTRSRGSNFFTGVILLEDFVPYRLAEEADG